MKKMSQDIYGTIRKKTEVDALSERDRYHLQHKPWVDARRSHRRATITLTLVVFVILSLIATVVVQQYLLAKRPRGKWASKIIPEKSAASSSFNATPDIQTQFMIDELTELKNVTLPEKGDMPLNTQWIKQAAYQLIRAEKATREGQFDEAVDSYQKALLIYPKLQGAHRQLGLAYLHKKDYRNAVQEFEKAKEEESMTYGLANNLGVSYLALEDYKKAEVSFLMATQINPQYALGLLQPGHPVSEDRRHRQGRRFLRAISFVQTGGYSRRPDLCDGSHSVEAMGPGGEPSPANRPIRSGCRADPLPPGRGALSHDPPRRGDRLVEAGRLTRGSATGSGLDVAAGVRPAPE